MKFREQLFDGNNRNRILGSNVDALTATLLTAVLSLAALP
jgi:hypothetical protein